MRPPLLFCLVLLLLAGSATIGFYELGVKPLQFDEGVNWYLASSLITNRTIPYDPAHFHGPLYFRILAVAGAYSESALRAPGVIAGLVTIIVCLIWVLRETKLENGSLGTISVISLCSLDPLINFYNRTAIHEALFALLTTSFYLTLWLWYLDRSIFRAALSGVIFGLLLATKETAVVPFVCGPLALMIANRGVILPTLKSTVAFLLAAVVSCGVGFGSADGALQVGAGIWHWLLKGLGDHSQDQPWWFYLWLLSAISPLALFSFITFWRSEKEASYPLLCAILSLAAYSVIPYKTPWLVLSILPLAYLGISLQLRNTASLGVVLTIAIGSHFLPMGESYLRRNDTSPEVKVIADKVLERCQSGNRPCRVFVGMKYYWPLPFYLHKINNHIQYESGPQNIPLTAFDLVLLDAAATNQIPGWSRAEYQLSRVQRISLYTRITDS